MEKAIEGYRLSKTADDYEEDNNNAVANVQQVVIYNILFNVSVHIHV